MAELDLESIVKECFEYNKEADKIYVVEDGTCFLENAKNHAKNYAHSKGLKVEGITRVETIEASTTEVEETKEQTEPTKEVEDVKVLGKEKEVKETLKKDTKK